MVKKTLDDLIVNGICEDIYKAETAYLMFEVIAEHATTINQRSNGNYGSVFGTVQRSLQTELVMALGRVFDKGDKRNSTRCLDELLQQIVNHKERPLNIEEPYQLEKLLEHRNAPKYLLDCIKNEPSEFPNLLRCYVDNEIKNTETRDKIRNLRNIRNKRFAHNDIVIKDKSIPDWESIESILELAKFAVAAIGAAYLSTIYQVDGTFFLTEDAKRPSLGMKRLLKQIYGNSSGGKA